jgi:hypothetical protein
MPLFTRNSGRYNVQYELTDGIVLTSQIELLHQI